MGPRSAVWPRHRFFLLVSVVLVFEKEEGEKRGPLPSRRAVRFIGPARHVGDFFHAWSDELQSIVLLLGDESCCSSSTARLMSRTRLGYHHQARVLKQKKKRRRRRPFCCRVYPSMGSRT
ncbi:hypothetical protein HDK64DRAFT_273106 [Phyllosticta capitalensis]|uniref:Secreted protein n=1 Tax=Phyllosticta capitalensis TaxID=121624 RepID=A0ABR1YJA4_9PEZI